MKQLIYIAEDEKNIRETLRSFLENDGYEVCAFETGDALLSAFSKRRADLVILDIMMPGTDGLTCCRIIREKDKVPIVLLTAKDTEYDYVNGILQGGDDYLTKPFRPTVLLMRVKALLRRVEMERGGNPMDRDVTVGDLRFSGAEKQLFCKGKIVSLSPNEMKMLLFLMHNEGKALSRDELLNQIWGYNDEVETRVTDETLRRIRSKLSAADSDILIETFGVTVIACDRKGTGYEAYQKKNNACRSRHDAYRLFNAADHGQRFNSRIPDGGSAKSHTFGR